MNIINTKVETDGYHGLFERLLPGRNSAADRPAAMVWLVVKGSRLRTASSLTLHITTKKYFSSGLVHRNVIGLDASLVPSFSKPHLLSESTCEHISRLSFAISTTVSILVHSESNMISIATRKLHTQRPVSFANLKPMKDTPSILLERTSGTNMFVMNIVPIWTIYQIILN